jgi:hypothetical protein
MKARAALVWLVILASGFGAARADNSVPAARAHDGWTFCEFEVFHQATRKPFAGVRYRVTLPGGRVRRGRVPANGIVHIDVPRAGECTIDLDLPRGYVIGETTN